MPFDTKTGDAVQDCAVFGVYALLQMQYQNRYDRAQRVGGSRWIAVRPSPLPIQRSRKRELNNGPRFTGAGFWPCRIQPL
jgi:hypothetical protein